MDIKARQQELVELRREAKDLASVVTSRHDEIKILDERVQGALEKLKISERVYNDTLVKAQEVKKQAQQEKAFVDAEKAEHARQKGTREKELRQLDKQLQKLNTSILNAQNELDAIGVLHEQKEARLREIYAKEQHVPELEALILTLEATLGRKREEYAAIEASTLELLRLAKKATEDKRTELERIKNERERETIALNDLKNDIVRQKHDISIYVARAQSVYHKVFPELEMKL